MCLFHRNKNSQARNNSDPEGKKLSKKHKKGGRKKYRSHDLEAMGNTDRSDR
jgi:hypothetical protein